MVELLEEKLSQTGQMRIVCGITKGFEAGKIAGLFFECYESNEKINILPIKIIIDTAGPFATSHLVEKLIESNNRKDLLKKARQLDAAYPKKK